jgi:hypothetical protein
MADLNELTQFEKDLKARIQERNSFKPNYNYDNLDKLEEQSKQLDGSAMTYMMVKEHGKPYKTLRPFQGLVFKMGIREHGQPYKQPQNQQFISLMCIGEHGQPYKKQPQNQQFITRMCIGEHGQPYKQPQSSTTQKHIVTNMCVREHGQPYSRELPELTLMCVREHGQPYKPRASQSNTNNFSTWDNSSPWDNELD